MNAIRRRVHMDELPSLTWEQLVNERRVELAFEETSYWDFFRWGIAEEKLNGTSNPLKAMKIVKRGETTTYSISNDEPFPTTCTRDSKRCSITFPFLGTRYATTASTKIRIG